MKRTLNDLIELMATLRSPNGCPWDREQTHQSLKSYVVEEAYEVLDAIDRGDLDELREELGDLLFQVVFQAQLAREAGHFDLYDVITSIHEKMVRRHPHVFGEGEAATAADVEVSWDALKAAEGRDRFGHLPRHLPALLKALRITEKAQKVGFDWPDAAGAREKVTEELAELDAALESADPAALADEFGDLLFSVVNWGRKLSLNPEDLLQQACDKFIARFRQMEAAICARGQSLDELDLAEMDRVWDAIKRGAGGTDR